MADNQFVRSGDAECGLLADDDPLSELARIVGYEARPAVAKLDDIRKQEQVLALQAPEVFDLEAELLREFDIYDRPKPAALAAAQPEPVADFAPAIEHPLAESEVMATEPMAAEITETYPADAEDWLPEDLVVDAIDEEPVLEPEEHIEAHAAPDVTPVNEPALRDAYEDAAYDLERELELSLGLDAPEVHDQDESVTFAEPEPVVAEARPVEPVEVETAENVAVEPDLYEETPEPVAYAPDPEPVAPVIEMQDAEVLPAAMPDWFHAVEDESPAHDMPYHDVPADLAVYDAPAMDVAAVEAQSVAPLEIQPVAEPETVPVPPAAVVAPVETVISAARISDIDSLLADVERFPVPVARPVREAVQPVVVPARKSAYPFTPTFSRATPVASDSTASHQKAFAGPVIAPVALAAAPVLAAALPTESRAAPVVDFAPVPDLPVWDEPVAPESAWQEPDVAVAAPVGDAEIDFDNFELDLSDIDLDLDLDASDFDLSIDDTIDDAFTAPEVATNGPVSMPVADPFEGMTSKEPVAPLVDDGLTFDPTLFSDAEEPVAAISEMDVPAVPVPEQDRPAQPPADYELDIESEIVHLFGAASAGAAVAAAAPASRNDSQPLAQSPAEVAALLEDPTFDRVVEEDFRRSLSERRAMNEARSSVAAEGPVDGYAEYPSLPGRNLLRRAALASVVVLLVGGGLFYAFLFRDGASGTTGEPQIILADKDPIKIVPVEKGGKTVPNQDKAVYDRVAGAQDSAPAQGTLVSSTEEPVDVVQRTLTPEQLPLEGSADAVPLPTATPVDPEETARLLPEEPAAAATDTAVPAVSPRKVKTMIVKPDGTLVAREDIVPAEQPVEQPVTELAAVDPAPASETTPVSSTATAEPVNPVNADAETPVAIPAADATLRQDQPVAQEQPVATPDAQQTALAEAATTAVEETAPVRVVRTTTITGQAPVPQSRPADQPVNVVGTVTDQGNVQTAAANPATTTATPAETPVQPQAASTTVPAGSYVVQIASLPSEAEAQRSYNNLSGRYTSVIGGRGVDIKKAEIAGKGTYYRVRIPAGSRDEANNLCARLKSAGGSCIVTR